MTVTDIAPPRRSRLVVEPIAAPRPHMLLAEQLREAILRGEIAEGEALPAERTLVEQTGLSRSAVREALRTLAAGGLLQSRPGRFGGNVVTLPGKDSLASAIAHFVRGRKLPLRTLHEARATLEPALAGLAAQHRSVADLKELTARHEALVAAAGDFPAFAHANVLWHNAVARASHNELLAAMLHALSQGLEVSTTIEAYDTPETRRQVIRIHARITQAIEARDAVEAERRMRQHIGAAQERDSARGGKRIAL